MAVTPATAGRFAKFVIPLVACLVLSAGCDDSSVEPVGSSPVDSPSASTSLPVIHAVVWECSSQAGRYDDWTDQVSYASELQDDLSDLETATDQDLVDAAAAIGNAIESEVPQPTMALEALGRIGWNDSSLDATVLLRTLEDAHKAACGNRLFSDAAEVALMSSVSGTRPVRFAHSTSVGFATDHLFGLCDTLDIRGWANSATPVLSCDDGYAAVDTTSGAVTMIQLDGDQHQTSGSREIVSSGGVTHVVVTEHKASGLHPRRWKATLVTELIRPESEEQRTEVGRGSGSVPKPEDFFLFGTREGTFVDSQGVTPNWYVPAEGDPVRLNSPPRFIAPGLAVVSDDGTILDAIDGSRAVLSSPFLGGAETSWDTCEGVAYIYALDGWIIDRTDRGIQLHKLPPATGGQYLDAFNSPDGQTIVVGSPLRSITWAGQEVWRLERDVVASWETFGRWIVVKNTSGRRVLVDPVTGRDVTASRQGTMELVKELAAEGFADVDIVDAEGTGIDSAADGKLIMVSAPPGEVCGP